jgi:predicted permease
VLIQVAGSLIVLVVSGLFVRSLNHAEHMYLGFDPDHVLNLMLDPHQIGYDETRTKTFYRDLEDRVRALPGVQSASLAFAVPLGYPGQVGPVFVEGVSLGPGQQPPAISYNSIDPNYFETMRIPLLRGRAFSESDGETTRRVAIVNETMAKKLWPDKDPIGKRFSLKNATEHSTEVVGIARDGQYLFLSPDPQPYFYVPLTQNYTSFRSLQIRSTVPPESLIADVQQKIRTLAPDLPVIDLSTMQQILHGLAGLFVFRLAGSLAGVMGILGLTLAVIGVYGVVSFSVTQRTHEIGIRMALGAHPSNILKLSIGRGIMLVAVGVVAGLFAAWAATRTMTRLPIGVSPSDPLTYVTVVLLLLTVTLLACWIPARRAMSVDPMIALRHE